MNDAEHQEIFERWLGEHSAILHHVANGFAEGDERKDLMQELLLAVWKAVPAFRGAASPSTFMYRVSHNAALTWRRTQRNYRRKVEEFGAQATETFDAPVDSSARLLERVYTEIRRLPALDRSLILLSLDGLGYRDMAAIHGLSEGNVGVRLNRARQKLIQALKEPSNEPE